MWDEYSRILRCDECDKFLAHISDSEYRIQSLCRKCYKKYNPPPTKREIEADKKSIAESRRIRRYLVTKCGENYRKRKLNRQKRKKK